VYWNQFDCYPLEWPLPDPPTIAESEVWKKLRRQSAWSSTLVSGLEWVKQGEVVMGYARSYIRSIGSPVGTRGRILDRGLLAGLSALTLCVVVAAVEAKAEAPHAAPAHDVVAFCQMHGTLDDPERTFFGPNYKYGMLPKPVEDTDATKWRCMDGKILVCQDSASGDWCSKKDPSREPSADIKEFCVDNPGSDAASDALEMYSASQWRCRGRKPVINGTWALDKRGFMQKMWPRLVIRNGVVVRPRPDDFKMR
jgi:hypothetical protein